MASARRVHSTYEEYLAALEVSRVELEYCDGEIYAMAGGTPAHADPEMSLDVDELYAGISLDRGQPAPGPGA